MLFVLTGNGKGKTTCAIGMGIRAVGTGRKVLLVQFLKGGGSSEEKALAQIKNFKVKSFGRPFFVLPKKDFQGTRFLEFFGKVRLTAEEDRKLAQKGFELAKNYIKIGKTDFLILDEICLALKYGLLNKKEVLDFLSLSLRGGAKRRQSNPIDIVLTGRYCPKEIMQIADLVTEFKEVKHYYRKGIKAREGIEY